MNISHKHKTIWWAPERCGTKAVGKILSEFGFTYYEDSTEKKLMKNEKGEIYQSHNIVIPEKYNDYKVICSIRNPYDRVFSLYLNFTSVGKTSVYIKSEYQLFKEKFGFFVEELFTFQKVKSVFNFPILEGKGILNNYVLKYNFNGRLPDQFIRMENMVEDMSKIEFIRESELWSNGFIEQYLNNNQYINVRPYSFSKMYELEIAKKVYNQHKKHFILCNYNPFSFTANELTNEEKMNFLHGIL